MIFKKSIKKRILEVIESKLEEVQKAFDAEIKSLEDEYEAAYLRLGEKLDIEKLQAEEKHINSVLAKII